MLGFVKYSYNRPSFIYFTYFFNICSILNSMFPRCAEVGPLHNPYLHWPLFKTQLASKPFNLVSSFTFSAYFCLSHPQLEKPNTVLPTPILLLHHMPISPQSAPSHHLTDTQYQSFSHTISWSIHTTTKHPLQHIHLSSIHCSFIHSSYKYSMSHCHTSLLF